MEDYMAAKKKDSFAQAQALLLRAVRSFEKTVAGMAYSATHPRPKRAKKRSKRKTKKKIR
jgi:hypothetical protein